MKHAVVKSTIKYKYLGSIIQRDGEIDGDVNHRIHAGWLKWRAATAVLCDRKFPSKLKGKFYRAAIRPALLYGTECWPVKKIFEHKMKVTEMRMLRWMCGHTLMAQIRNQEFREKLGIAPIFGKMRENRLRWFEHVQRKCNIPEKLGSLQERFLYFKRKPNRTELNQDVIKARENENFKVKTCGSSSTRVIVD